MVLDLFSKYGWIVVLKDKKGETVTQAFKTIFEEGCKPQYLWTDKGKECYNKKLKDLLQKHNITLYSFENPIVLFVLTSESPILAYPYYINASHQYRPTLTSN